MVATEDILPGTELNVNYQQGRERVSKGRKSLKGKKASRLPVEECKCGAEKCAGSIWA